VSISSEIYFKINKMNSQIMQLNQKPVDKKPPLDILTPEEVAEYLQKSTSWVYKNQKLLGGRKLGGSLFFPAKEDLYERLFYQGKGMALRVHRKRSQVHKGLVQNKNRGETSPSIKKGGDKEPKTTRSGREDPNRHGLLGTS
jgi:hypothetical protein